MRKKMDANRWSRFTRHRILFLNAISYSGARWFAVLWSRRAKRAQSKPTSTLEPLCAITSIREWRNISTGSRKKFDRASMIYVHTYTRWFVPQVRGRLYIHIEKWKKICTDLYVYVYICIHHVRKDTCICHMYIHLDAYTCMRLVHIDTQHVCIIYM